jgi:hypothetical protein
VAELDTARTDAGPETAGKVDVTWQEFGVNHPTWGSVLWQTLAASNFSGNSPSSNPEHTTSLVAS